MEFVSGLVGLLLMWVIFAGMEGGSDLDIIKKCLPDNHYLRKHKRKNYRLYVFSMSWGEDFNAEKAAKILQNFLGKKVIVSVNKVIYIQVYYELLPKRAVLPSLGKKNNAKIGIGIGYDGRFYHNFLKYPHMVVAGTTGYGKTTLIKSMMPQLDGELVILDLKRSKDYHNVSAYTIEEAVQVLERIEDEFHDWRKDHLFVIVDEAAELQPKDYMTRKEKKPYLYCQRVMALIAAQGRSKKVHLIYATQYPTADVIPRFVKQNAETRISFRLPTDVASRVALDEAGAEKLPKGLRGRCLYKIDSVEELQSYVISEGEDEIIDDWTKIRVTKTARTKDTITIG